MQQYFEKHPDKHPSRSETARNTLIVTISSALARGYIATYEVRNGQLFLKDIEINHWLDKSKEPTTKSVMKEVFPDGKPLKIDWLSGTFVLKEKHPGRETLRLKVDKGDVKEIELALKETGETLRLKIDSKPTETPKALDTAEVEAVIKRANETIKFIEASRTHDPSNQ